MRGPLRVGKTAGKPGVLVVAVTLNALSLSTSSGTVDTAATVNITGASAGSTITGTPPDGMTLNSAARTISGTPTTTGTYSLVLTETLAGATNSPRSTTLTFTVSAAAVTLAALGLAANSVTENTAANATIGGILNRTAGSTLSLVDSAGNRLALSGTNIVTGATPTDYETATSHSITIRETLAGASNSPRDTVLTISVTNVFEQPSLVALGFSATGFIIGTPATGSISGATAGSTIAAAGLPASITINSAGRTFAYNGSGPASTPSITLTETLADSANSPKASTFGVTVAAAPSNAAFTLTQLPDSNRTYQRGTITGGGGGKGQGTVAHTLNVSTVGTIYARCRASSDGTTILQAPWAAVSVSSTGSQTVNISGVDARKEGFFVDLSGDGTTWTSGTTVIRMGGLTATDGQSLSVRLFKHGNSPNYTDTYASLGITPSPNSYCYAIWSDANEMPGNLGLNQYNAFPGTPQTWQAPSNSGYIDSAFACEYLRYMEAWSGVAWGMIGAPAGATAIASHAPGQSIYTKNQQVFAAAGGAWEEFIWFQGHQDGNNGTSYASYMSGLSATINGYNSANAFSGVRVRVATIPYVNSTGYGSSPVIAGIRKAGIDWAAANNATYHALPDFETYDLVHQNGAGAIKIAVHFARAARPAFGLVGSDVGPTIASVSRTGTNLVITFNLPSGATTLVQTGNVAQRLFLYEAGGQTDAWNFGTGTISGNTISYPDPYAEQAFDLYLDYNRQSPTGSNGATAILRDNHIEADESALGITIGRATVQSVAGFSVPAYTGLVPRDMTMTSAAYVAGTTGFGQRLNAGFGVRTNFPSPPRRTLETRFEYTVQPGAIAVMFGEDTSRMYVALNASGFLVINVGGTIYTGSTNLVGTGEHHVEVGLDFVTGTVSAFLDGAKLTTSAITAGAQNGQASPQIEVRGLTGNNFVPSTGNRVDELALWKGVRHTAAFTAPTAPYVGNEAGLIALYHFDGSAADSHTAPAP